MVAATQQELLPSVVATESPSVVATESRAYDDSTRDYRLQRREIVGLCAAAARKAADAAVDCALDADLLEALDGRIDLKAAMDAAGASGLPLSFGATKRPKKKRKKKQQKAPKPQGPSAHADAENPFPGVVDDKRAPRGRRRSAASK